MKSNKIRQNFESQIQELIEIISGLTKKNDNDDEIVSDLCRYLCILVSGYFERTLIHILLDYTKNKVPNSIYQFVDSKLRGSTNFNKSKVEELLKSFNPVWVEKLHSWDDYDYFGDVIGYFYGNRNKIAHGENTTVSISDLETNYKVLKEFFDKLIFIINCKR